MAVKAPLGSSIEYTVSRIRMLEEAFAEFPEILGSFATIGEDQARQVSQARIIVEMVPWGERELSQRELMQAVEIQAEAGISRNSGRSS